MGVLIYLRNFEYKSQIANKFIEHNQDCSRLILNARMLELIYYYLQLMRI